MSLVTDYIAANRPSCIGLWDFGAGVGDPMVVDELITGITARQFIGTGGGYWTTGQSGSGFAGQDAFSSIAVLGGIPNAAITSSAGADPYAFALGAPCTYEIMVRLASASGTQDLLGPDGNTNGGLCIRTNGPTAKWEAVENYIAVPVGGTIAPDTDWHTLAITVDSSSFWKLFVDGAQDGSTSGSFSASPTGSAALDVARCNHANPTSASSWGYVAIYNTELSAGDLLDNYTVALDGPPAGAFVPKIINM